MLSIDALSILILTANSERSIYFWVVRIISIVLVMHSTILVSGAGHSILTLGIVGVMILISEGGFDRISFISDSIYSERLCLTSLCMGRQSVPTVEVSTAIVRVA